MRYWVQMQLDLDLGDFENDILSFIKALILFSEWRGMDMLWSKCNILVFLFSNILTKDKRSYKIAICFKLNYYFFQHLIINYNYAKYVEVLLKSPFITKVCLISSENLKRLWLVFYLKNKLLSILLTSWPE